MLLKEVGSWPWLQTDHTSKVFVDDDIDTQELVTTLYDDEEVMDVDKINDEEGAINNDNNSSSDDGDDSVSHEENGKIASQRVSTRHQANQADATNNKNNSKKNSKSYDKKEQQKLRFSETSVTFSPMNLKSECNSRSADRAHIANTAVQFNGLYKSWLQTKCPKITSYEPLQMIMSIKDIQNLEAAHRAPVNTSPSSSGSISVSSKSNQLQVTPEKNQLQLHNNILYSTEGTNKSTMIVQTAKSQINNSLRKDDHERKLLRNYLQYTGYQPALSDCEIALINHLDNMFRLFPPLAYSNSSQFKLSSLLLEQREEARYHFITQCLNTRSAEEIRNILANPNIFKDNIPSKIFANYREANFALSSTTNSNTTYASRISKNPANSKDKSTRHLTAVKNDFENDFQPCHHPGKSCKEAGSECRCFENKSFCEKFCGCNSTEFICELQFAGCDCKRGACKTGSCKCVAACRVCDPDLCGCGSSIPYPLRSTLQQYMITSGYCLPCNAPLSSNSGSNNGKEESSSSSVNNPLRFCCNESLSYRPRKKVYVSRSKVHGWGVFAGEKIEKNDYIMEYTGEVISQLEAERRGLIYDKQQLSCLFEVNQFQVVDATRKGNRAKFINHSKDKPNVIPKIVQESGDHHVMLLAKCSIEPGQELFFDYQYDAILGDHAPGWAGKEENGHHSKSKDKDYDSEDDKSNLKNGRKRKVSEISSTSTHHKSTSNNNHNKITNQVTSEGKSQQGKTIAVVTEIQTQNNNISTVQTSSFKSVVKELIIVDEDD
jgi:hypothetical protein